MTNVRTRLSAAITMLGAVALMGAAPAGDPSLTFQATVGGRPYSGVGTGAAAAKPPLRSTRSRPPCT